MGRPALEEPKAEKLWAREWLQGWAEEARDALRGEREETGALAQCDHEKAVARL